MRVLSQAANERLIEFKLKVLTIWTMMGQGGISSTVHWFERELFLNVPFIHLFVLFLEQQHCCEWLDTILIRFLLVLPCVVVVVMIVIAIAKSREGQNEMFQMETVTTEWKGHHSL